MEINYWSESVRVCARECHIKIGGRQCDGRYGGMNGSVRGIGLGPGGSTFRKDAELLCARAAKK